ncbi:protein of unassigned function [Methylobacterium oryzae CBMB20]|uniref:Protein of unassigned function n=1 Tax=Methylobacterium oryzae CBMB20 TaxID=693986 RepID=A0A089Q7F9_9HYPH|nr:protein of unassigned function [Methylobacterium oryzae CBMB20]
MVLAGGIAGSSAAFSRQEPIPGQLWRRDGRTFAAGTPSSVTTASASPG